MKFSIAKEVITPNNSVFLHGFGSRTHKSEGVLDPVYMKAALIQANCSLLMITIDAVGSDRSFIAGIKDDLQDRFGLAHDEVMINFSHTHHYVFLTGIDTGLRRGGYSMGQSKWAEDENELDFSEDEAYFCQLRDTLLRMTAYCYENLSEGELWMAAVPPILQLTGDGLPRMAKWYISIWWLDEETHLIAMEGEVSTEYSV